jgi:hypothetical protein
MIMKTIKIWLDDAFGGFSALGTVNALGAVCLAMVLMLGSCGRGSGLSIAGTYVSHESGEYSISRDTLLILPVGGEGNYKVIRRSGFQKIREGKLQPEEIRVLEYSGRYDADLALLEIDGEEKWIRFFAGGKSLLLVKREYQKVVEP